MEPWYKVVTLREEVRRGRSFHPNEFAVALEQIAQGTAPPDYQDPAKFYSRTCFTSALREHLSSVLRRLSGETEASAPVMALLTQFGGGKTHTLAALYHAVKSPAAAHDVPQIRDLLDRLNLADVPPSRVAVFVGNSWDPSKESPTPWVDVARQLAGSEGVAALGPEARSKAPGTTSLHRLYEAAGGSVLVLFDEVLNYLSRHRDRGEAFKDFLSTMVRSMTGTTRCAAVLSLPASKPEMTDWELRWQEIISKEVGRVARQLIANDEAEISDVVRRRLFEDLGGERARRNVAKEFAEWCFERRAQLPPEWTAVDSASTEKKALARLTERFEACYPFHPATLSVFQRKWQALPQYQQTRGTLAMFAHWIAHAARSAFREARTEPLITLGSAPLEEATFRSLLLSQLGEPRLGAAIASDISGEQAHTLALDADTKGPLRDIHRRVGTAILFESSGGQVQKVAHLPELRFALGGPGVDTTSVDNAASALEARAFFLRKVGTDGYQIHHRATLKKVVSDRRASLDLTTEIQPTIRSQIRTEFERGATLPVMAFPEDGTAIPDSPRLTLVVAPSEWEWTGAGEVRARVSDWTRRRAESDRLYPGALVWCLRKPGREHREKVEHFLAWKRVQTEIAEGTLGSDFEPGELADARRELAAAEREAREEVWSSYRYAVIFDPGQPDGLEVIDLGAGHSSGSASLCGRVVEAMRSGAKLNEGVGAGYLERNWPPALKDSGAWPLASLRQSFLNGCLTRLADPDRFLKGKIPEFVLAAELGLASGKKADGTFERIWFDQVISPDEVGFDPGVFLLSRKRATELTRPATPSPASVRPATPEAEQGGGHESVTPAPPAVAAVTLLRITGEVPPESWNRLGTKLLPKLRTGDDLRARVDLEVRVPADRAAALLGEVKLLVDDLGLGEGLRAGLE